MKQNEIPTPRSLPTLTVLVDAGEEGLHQWVREHVPRASRRTALAEELGPRYRGRDPDLPFVGVSASDRRLVPPDRDRLVAIAHETFGAFKPGFVLLTTADPGGAWPDTRPEMRHAAAGMGGT